MVGDTQSDLLQIAALVVLSHATSNDILSEHAWTLAVEQADQHGLSVTDAIYNLEYVYPHSLVE